MRLRGLWAVAAGVGVSLMLAGCAPTVGGPLAGQMTRVACADIPDYSVPLLVTQIRNSSRSAVTVIGVVPGRVNNLMVSTIRVGRDGHFGNAVLSENDIVYRKSYVDPAVKPVTVPAGQTYDVLALASLVDNTADGTLSSFRVTYTADKRTYVFDTAQAYRLSTRLTCQ